MSDPAKILIWLPSPMGDAILCTVALKAIRKRFACSKITFLGNSTVQQVLSQSDFCNGWIEQEKNCPFAAAKELRKHNFDQVILFKNSFKSALICWLARIPSRVGYARDGRGLFLNEKLCPAKLNPAAYKPVPMVNYYLAVASWLGAETDDRQLELSVSDNDLATLKQKLPQAFDSAGPLVILVPGAAGGPSKCWLPERFDAVADELISKHNATVIVSVAPNKAERDLSKQILSKSKNTLLSIADKKLSLGELKALIAQADMMIANDTGPRHMAIALKQKVITLIGPNDPQWINLDYADETEICANVSCSPCNKHICSEKQHYCMEAITLEMVLEAAEKMLAK